MVVAFDIDDTISRHPQFFAFLTQALIAAGHKVLIITFRSDRQSDFWRSLRIGRSKDFLDRSKANVSCVCPNHGRRTPTPRPLPT